MRVQHEGKQVSSSRFHKYDTEGLTFPGSSVGVPKRRQESPRSTTLDSEHSRGGGDSWEAGAGDGDGAERDAQ